jgi:hypothetical protein
MKSLNIAFALLICAMIAGCYSTGSEDPGPVATIVRIEQDPAVISPTDTVKFTMIVTNQRQQAVKYAWSFGGKGNHLNGVRNPGDTYIYTDSPFIYWTPAGSNDVMYGTAQIHSLNQRFNIASDLFRVTIE